MPMGIVSDKDFEQEIKDSGTELREAPKPIPITSIITPADVNRGRKQGDNNVPNALRNTIAQVAVTEGRESAIEMAKDFGISESSVAAYSNGATSTASYHKTPNKPIVNAAKLRVSTKARGKLLLALNSLTPEKMREAKAVELSSIAKNMSGIVKDMEPPADKDKEQGENRPQFIVFAPVVRSETMYETIFVKE
jgi:hypothetical protein